MIALLGRIFYSTLFILTAVNLFSSTMITYATSRGVPFAEYLVPIAGSVALIGGFSVLLGYYAQYGAALIVLFLIPVTLTIHNFWQFADPIQYQLELANFLKNLSLLGGALLISYHGAGPYSVDSLTVDVQVEKADIKIKAAA